MAKEKRRQQYPKEFKLEAVRLCDGRSMSEVAESLGVSKTALYRWRKELRADGAEAFRGQGNRTALEEENRRLRLENHRLRQEAEILKKASTYFAKHLG